MLYMANTFDDPKPIQRVNENLHCIKRDLNQVKIEMQYMKSDILLIKEYFKRKDKEEEEEKEKIAKGWLVF